MPIYEYECRACGRQREIIQKHSDEPLSACPDCGGEMKKLISNTSFVLKGSGWYKTDYAAPGSRKSSEGEKTQDASSSAPKDKAETPKETKKETATAT